MLDDNYGYTEQDLEWLADDMEVYGTEGYSEEDIELARDYQIRYYGKCFF